MSINETSFSSYVDHNDKTNQPKKEFKLGSSHQGNSGDESYLPEFIGAKNLNRSTFSGEAEVGIFSDSMEGAHK